MVPGAARDLAVQQKVTNFRVEVQIHLACVATLKGDEDEAVELLSQLLQGWLDHFGPCTCAGCFQVRGEDAPMLSCAECRVVRCVYAATPLPCGTDCHACRAEADREAWVDDVGPRRCAGCGQVRGEDAPMLRCDGCRVARCVYAATFVCCAAATGMLAVG